MGGRLLNPELAASVSGATHAHSMQVEVVNLDEVAWCQLSKTRSSPITAMLC